MTAAGAGTPPALGRWAVVLAGAVSLAVAMGIGRFAFTPLLPMMLHDGVIDLPSASWLASANYLGYLAGALLCTFQPWIWARAPGLPPIDGPWMVRAGLVATGVLTLGMALPWPALWPLLRFAAGVASAFVFVYASGWVLSQMVRLQAPAMASVMYTGPGAGIVVSGLFASAMVQWRWHALDAWLVFGLLAFLLSALVWRTFRGGEAPQPAAGVNARAGAGSERHTALEVGFLCFGYGIAGFGYIVTATFLPVIARSALPGSPWLDMFWPIFGFGVFCGALIASRLRVNGDLRLLLAGGYFIQAAGIAVGVCRPSLAGFAIGSLMLGLPFTAILLRDPGSAAPAPGACREFHGSGDSHVRHRPDRRAATGGAAAAPQPQRRCGLHAVAADRDGRLVGRRAALPVDGAGVPDAAGSGGMTRIEPMRSGRFDPVLLRCIAPSVAAADGRGAGEAQRLMRLQPLSWFCTGVGLPISPGGTWRAARPARAGRSSIRGKSRQHTYAISKT